MLKHLIPLALFAISTPTWAENAAKVEAKKEQAAPVVEKDLGKISESLGHLIAKNLETLGFDLDMARVLKGVQDSQQGKTAPLTETECIQAITALQEERFNDLAAKNLADANTFMEKNVLEKGIVAVQKGKLHYRVDSEGKGAIVQSNDSPVIRYTGRFMDGKVFGQSKHDETISLEDTISGFKEGIVGMKEGEKRTLYIHPEMGYGTSSYLPPNALLTFEIEVVKANAPKEEPLSETENPEISKEKK